MQTIIVINDDSTLAAHAAGVALHIAQKHNANLLLANLTAVDESKTIEYETSINKGYHIARETYEEQTSLADYLRDLCSDFQGFKPAVESLDASNLQEREFADLAAKYNAWMIIQGCGDIDTSYAMPSFDSYSLLNFIKCPLMFIPSTFTVKSFERAVYMADLRYGQPSVVRYLSNFLKTYRANLLFAHLSASGLPDMEMEYALTLFKETIGSAVSYDQIGFNNIKERKMEKAIDVLVHGMGTDLLAVVNHQFHFKELLSKSMSLKQLPQTVIPIMIFPF
jgi:nucleotide-binding universal stress UspA family protein